MDLLIEFVWFFVQVVVITFIITFGMAYIRYRRQTKEIAADLIEKVTEITHIVKIENHNDILYWFDKDSDQFLGQGATMEECVAHVKGRYPGHLFFFPASKTLLRAPNWQFEKLIVNT